MMLNCDETQEIRLILKGMRILYDKAWELNAIGEGTELSKMVTTYIPAIKQSYLYFTEKAGKNGDKTDAMEEMKEAREKQEPKKVIQYGKEGDEHCGFECPVCGFYLNGIWKEETLCYCSGCGQKLDWGSEN